MNESQLVGLATDVGRSIRLLREHAEACEAERDRAYRDRQVAEAERDAAQRKLDAVAELCELRRKQYMWPEDKITLSEIESLLSLTSESQKGDTG